MEFLQHSNWIESEYSDDALYDALKAWDYLIKQKKLDKIRLLRTHELLLSRLNGKIAGKVRRCKVYIGGEEALEYKKIDKELNDWFKFPVKTAKDARLAHVIFEGIHPFEDGNGRVGRMLLNWQRLKAGIGLLIIHEGDEQMNYYRWFRFFEFDKRMPKFLTDKLDGSLDTL